MLNQPIQFAERELWRLLAAIGQMPQVPSELVEELFQIQRRLTTHVVDLRHKKAQLDVARADLEGI